MTNKIPDSWCPLPWGHISTTSSGLLRVCCQANTSTSKGLLLDDAGQNMSISSNTLAEAQNSDILKKLRLQLLNGEWGDECIRCKREFNPSTKSRNIYERGAEWATNISFEKAKTHTMSDGSIDPEIFPVTFLDLRFGNKCNLKCVMCSPTDSNRWYDDYVAIWNVTSASGGGSKVSLIQKPNGKYTIAEEMDWFTNATVWAELERNLQHISRIYIAGGEPTLIDEHFEFLQKCITLGHSEHMCIEYNSNISMIPDRAWEIWSNFKEIIIGCSVDGIGDVNDLIRFPSKWNRIEANINKLYVAPPNFIFHITTSIQILNIWTLPEFVEYMISSSNVDHRIWPLTPLKISAHPVHNPSLLNVNILPLEFKEQIKTKFNTYIDTLTIERLSTDYGNSKNVAWDKKIDNATRILASFIKFMDEILYSESELNTHRKHFVRYMDKLDQLRGTQWATVCPEIYTATEHWRYL